MIIVNKCLITHTEGVIAHGVNCCGVMGKGVTLSIREAYPIVAQKYFELFTNKVESERLGTVQIVHINPKLICYNLFTQCYYGQVLKPFGGSPQNLDYGALDRCLNILFADCSRYDLRLGMSRVGTNLAGGDTGIVESFIRFYEKKYSVQATIYDPEDL